MVTLEDVKGFLGIELSNTSHDSFLLSQISVVSDSVEGYCNRKFKLGTYAQFFYREDFHTPVYRIPLHNFPIVSLVSIEEADSDDSLNWNVINNYRLHKETGTLSSNEAFFRSGKILKITYSSGFAVIPPLISHVIFSIVEERFNRKVSGVSLNFGADVQRISIPGSIAIDFDYTLSHNERKSTYGLILGNFLNVLDPYRSERVIIGASKLSYIESL